MIGIISFVGFTLLVAGIAYWSTKGTDENSSEGFVDEFIYRTDCWFKW